MNSLDAMDKGGSLTITVARSESDQLSIKIQDTGCGISKEDIPHVFDPFFSTKERGTGLGLSIVQGIIRNHHGTIDVESQLKVGTSFIIRLGGQMLKEANFSNSTPR